MAGRWELETRQEYEREEIPTSISRASPLRMTTRFRTVTSPVWIEDDGRRFRGHEAMERAQRAERSARSVQEDREAEAEFRRRVSDGTLNLRAEAREAMRRTFDDRVDAMMFERMAMTEGMTPTGRITHRPEFSTSTIRGLSANTIIMDDFSSWNMTSAPAILYPPPQPMANKLTAPMPEQDGAIKYDGPEHTFERMLIGAEITGEKDVRYSFMTGRLNLFHTARVLQRYYSTDDAVKRILTGSHGGLDILHPDPARCTIADQALAGTCGKATWIDVNRPDSYRAGGHSTSLLYKAGVWHTRPTGNDAWIPLNLDDIPK